MNPISHTLLWTTGKSHWPLSYTYVPGVIVTTLDSIPGNFPSCLPVNTYQIISSETTKTEIQHIMGMSCGNNRANIILSFQTNPSCGQLQTTDNYKYQQSQQRKL
jgi:hypothetical protein